MTTAEKPICPLALRLYFYYIDLRLLYFFRRDRLHRCNRNEVADVCEKLKNKSFDSSEKEIIIKFYKMVSLIDSLI